MFPVDTTLKQRRIDVHRRRYDWRCSGTGTGTGSSRIGSLVFVGLYTGKTSLFF